MLKITPFIMYNNQLDAALKFYVSIFKNSKIVNVTRYGDDGPDPKGAVMSAEFVLEDQPFMAFNGGEHFTFSDGISLFVSCETQAEVDDLWEKLSEGGEKGPCGWLKDKFGVSWQIVPTALGQLLGDKDPKKAQAVMQAMLKMTKLDIAGLRRAYEQA
jgi:predicted 3-demethylubiquinone-9 3-methyltransferase (glyoxalase superfamily)